MVDQHASIDSGQPGAQLHNLYLKRSQHLVAVNKTELEEIQSFDLFEKGLYSAGMFFFSGGIWLGIESLFDSPRDTMLLSMCALSTIFGGILAAVGVCIWKMRRKKINNLFDEIENRED